MAYTYVPIVESDPFYQLPAAVHQSTYKRNLGAIVTAISTGFSNFHSLFENHVLLEAGQAE